MLTEYEAQRLQRDMRQELDATPGTVFKCAMGLLLVAALALIFGADPQRDVASAAPVANHSPR